MIDKALNVAAVAKVKTGLAFALQFLCFMFFGSVAFAQNTITGKVVDSLGNPIPSVSITVRGTNKGTSTDSIGRFQLNNVASRAMLSFSNIGYQTQEVRLAVSQTFVSLVLRNDATALQDVVVTGFQRIDKKKFTGAAVTLKAEDVKIDGVIDVSRMLEGRAAGVSVQNVSSTFGSAPKVRVRGATSINGDNKPLWVVDGVVLEDIINISNDQLSSGDPTTLLGSSVAGINSNDIETFDILKDAAATALYGARAMNGVVVITTKKGKAGKPRYNYTGKFQYAIKTTVQQLQYHELGPANVGVGRTGTKRYFDTRYFKPSQIMVCMEKCTISSIRPMQMETLLLLNTTEAKSAFLKRYATGQYRLV